MDTSKRSEPNAQIISDLISRGTEPWIAELIAGEPLFAQPWQQMQNPEHLRDLEVKRRARRRDGRCDWALSMQIQTARREQRRMAKPINRRARPLRARQNCSGTRRPAHRSVASTRAGPDDSEGEPAPGEPRLTPLLVGRDRRLVDSFARIRVIA